MLTDTEIADAELRRWQHRFEQHLDQIPALIEHLRAAAIPSAVARLDGVRVSGGGYESAAQIRLDPVEDADDLWAALAEYTLDVANRLHQPAPSAAGDTWIAHGNVQGIPARLDADRAYKAAWGIVAWLTERSAQVRPLELVDSEQHLFALVRKLISRHTIDPIDRPTRRRACTVCGERAVVVAWILNDTGEAECRVCGATYAPENDRADSTVRSGDE